MLRKKWSKSSPWLRAAIIFTVDLVATIFIYALMRDNGELHVNYSISRYMGREGWSAGLFLISNIFVAREMWRGVKGMRKKYGEWWEAWGVVTLIGFIALSLCPVGLFDTEWGQYGVVSILHQIFSRMMFVAMGMMLFMMAMKTEGVKFRNMFMGFVTYGLICAAMSFATEVFWDLTLIFETLYIYGFLLMLAIVADE